MIFSSTAKNLEQEEDERTLPCMIIIHVEDTGIGISHKGIASLFKRFSQFNTRISKV